MTISSPRPLAGTSLPDLAGLYGEIYEQSRSASPDQDKDETFDDRAVRLDDHLPGCRRRCPGT